MTRFNFLFLNFCMLFFIACSKPSESTSGDEFQAFKAPISWEVAEKRADSLLALMTIDEKILMCGGHNNFFTQGFEKYKIPQFYFSDATQGVHIRKELQSNDKSTAFPCPIALTASWNPQLAHAFAQSIGEECRASDVAVLLGPGMNIYRIAQNGRNFEYFGEDPFLAARMVENYVVGMQSTGTISTLKHFMCNNTDFRRRYTNSIVDERALHEIYLPAFKAGVDAGAMAVMTSYNQVNGEWAGQNEYLINQLLKKELGFKGLVMTDWWSVYDPEKTIKSGLDLEMPGHAIKEIPDLAIVGDVYVRTNATRLLKDGKITEAQITRMAKTSMRTFIAMGLYDRAVKDTSFKHKYVEHEQVALQTAREGIVLLRNENKILPLSETDKKNILLVGKYVDNVARGLGSAEVEGYNNVQMIDAFKNEFGTNVSFSKSPTDEAIKAASIVIVSVGTSDTEGCDKSFELDTEMEKLIERVAAIHSKVIVVVSGGGGLKMTNWNTKVSAIIYAWYAGQNGNTALAEIVSGKTNPSAKLPITIEKKFEDSPGANYLPAGTKLYTGWDGDIIAPKFPILNIEYKESILVGYRWYEAKKIEPLYPFGFGLSYTNFEYSDLKVSNSKISKTDGVEVSFTLKNTGQKMGAEIAQLYVQSEKSVVERAVKELKAFKKVVLNPGESKIVRLKLKSTEFAYWDIKKHEWTVEAGNYNLLLGASSKDIKQKVQLSIQ